MPGTSSKFFPDGLAPEAVEKLESGGSIHWDDQKGDRRLVDPQTKKVKTVPSLRVDPPPVGWSGSLPVVMLRDGANKLDFPIEEGAIFYTGLTNSQAETFVKDMQAKGLDTEQIEAYAPPDSPATPLILSLTTISLLLLLFTTTMFAVRTQVDSLRGTLATALAIGLQPGWCKRVVLFEFALSALIATVLALVVALFPAFIASVNIDSMVLDVP